MTTDDVIRGTLESALSAQYSILKLLGRGGMGAVYLAHDRSLDRSVAIKVLPPEVATSVGRERFRREAQTAANLNHPNIVPLHAFGEADGMMYFVMGYVTSGSLTDRLRQLKRLPSGVVREIMVDVADALDYAHRQGVVHRDIKPDNILIDEQTSRPMLTDFGIAKGTTSQATLTGLGVPIGTPMYMSPEQALGEQDVDGRSDIYSLGVMAYELLAGKSPFNATTVRDILAQHISRKPAPLTRVAPDVPPDLADAVMRCLGKKPAERWRDAGQLRNALQHGHGGIVEKRSWFDGVLAGKVAPFAWVLSFLLAFAAATNAAGSPRRLQDDPFLLSVTLERPLAIVLMMAVPIMSIAFWQSKHAELGWTDVVKMLFRQPQWWHGWFPKPLRHPATADIWPWLPMGLKALYTFYDVSLVLVVFTLLPSTLLLVAMPPEVLELSSGSWPFLGSAHSGRVSWDTWILWLALVGYFVSMIWLRRRGLSVSAAHHVATSRALAPMHESVMFWKRPQLAQLLAEGNVRPTDPIPQPTTPREYLDGVRHVVTAGRMEDSEQGARAVQIATDLVRLIEGIDADIASLEGHIDRDQMTQLEKRFGAFATDTGSDDVPNSEVDQLLVSQLELYQRVAAQIDEKSEFKSRIVELLKRLWQELRLLEQNTESDQRLRSFLDELESIPVT